MFNGTDTQADHEAAEAACNQLIHAFQKEGWWDEYQALIATKDPNCTVKPYESSRRGIGESPIDHNSCILWDTTCMIRVIG